MPSKSKLKLLPIALLLTLILVSPAFAPAGGGGAHLWFYSQDPDTLPGPQPLPDPQTYDPNYVGANPDQWVSDSIVIPTGDWSEPFMIWLGLKQKNSTNTKLVVSINDAANNSIQSILINGTALTSWDTSGSHPILSPHGVFNAPDFYGYAEAPLGNLYSPPGSPYKVAIKVTIILNGPSALADAKIHFDAYGYTEEGALVTSPYSHDLTFITPEPATLLATLASVAGLGLYAYKRKKK